MSPYSQAPIASALCIAVLALGSAGCALPGTTVYVTNFAIRHCFAVRDQVRWAAHAAEPCDGRDRWRAVRYRGGPDGRSVYVANRGEGLASSVNVCCSRARSCRSRRRPCPRDELVVRRHHPERSQRYSPTHFVHNADSVSQYDVAPDSGKLTPKSPATVSAGDAPFAIAVSPDGRSAYVVNEDSATVWQYDVSPVSGALSPKTPATVATQSGPLAIALTPDGKHAYVTNGGGQSISQYDVNPVSGALSEKPRDRPDRSVPDRHRRDSDGNRRVRHHL